jgi:hypothetical protein
MSRDALSLARVQEWLQEVIVHPGALEDALARPAAAALVDPVELGQVVLPSDRLSSAQRVGIYHDMHLLRMDEALGSDYPALRHYLGGELFRGLVRDYVEAHPSRSYTLNRLGDRLPEFVAGWTGARAVPRPRRARRGDEGIFLAELARLELAITEAFDAEESPVLDAGAAARVPSAELPAARLVPVASLRLLATRFDLGPHLDAARQDEPAVRPARRRRFVAVFRRDFSVRRLALGSAEFALLAALAAAVPLGEAVERTAAQHPAGCDGGRVFDWFRKWFSLGMFARIALPGTP